MNRSPAALRRIALPEFHPNPVPPPELPVVVYRRRLDRLKERMKARNLDVLVVYADREHSANLAYLTGFDPRFEEALLLVSVEGGWKLLVGNECMGYLPDTKGLGLEVELFQEFSLLGQPRESSRPLRTILQDFAVQPNRRVGCVGWKYFEPGLLEQGERSLDLPAYLVDMLRDLTKHPEVVVNATDLFMGVQDGLRVVNEPEQIAQFEYASSVSSNGVLNLLRHLKTGVPELELERLLDSRGLPLSCHRMISFGEKARRGLASPGRGKAQLGDVYTTALGVQGALTSRAGVIAHGPAELPEAIREFYPRFVTNYFEVVTTWYEKIGIDVPARNVVEAVESVRNNRLFRFAVNPGHYLHLDEWVHSPFYPESQVNLRSGMALQMDIIPVSQGPFCYSNAEDGVVLADEPLRRELENLDAAMWNRIRARRQFMVNELGIRLDESVLPLSNIPGWLPPYALDLSTIFSCASVVKPAEMDLK